MCLYQIKQHVLMWLRTRNKTRKKMAVDCSLFYLSSPFSRVLKSSTDTLRTCQVLLCSKPAHPFPSSFLSFIISPFSFTQFVLYRPVPVSRILDLLSVSTFTYNIHLLVCLRRKKRRLWEEEKVYHIRKRLSSFLALSLAWHMVVGTCSPVLWTFWPLLRSVAMICQLGKERRTEQNGP